jgi:hypothetical protein
MSDQATPAPLAGPTVDTTTDTTTPSSSACAVEATPAPLASSEAAPSVSTALPAALLAPSSSLPSAASPSTASASYECVINAELMSKCMRTVMPQVHPDFADAVYSEQMIASLCYMSNAIMTNICKMYESPPPVTEEDGNAEAAPAAVPEETDPEKLTLYRFKRALDACFPGELRKHAYAQAQRPATADIGTAITEEFLRLNPSADAQFAKLLGAVIEYILAELCELGGNTKKDYKNSLHTKLAFADARTYALSCWLRTTASCKSMQAKS